MTLRSPGPGRGRCLAAWRRPGRPGRPGVGSGPPWTPVSVFAQWAASRFCEHVHSRGEADLRAYCQSLLSRGAVQGWVQQQWTLLVRTHHVAGGTRESHASSCQPLGRSTQRFLSRWEQSGSTHAYCSWEPDLGQTGPGTARPQRQPRS